MDFWDHTMPYFAPHQVLQQLEFRADAVLFSIP